MLKKRKKKKLASKCIFSMYPDLYGWPLRPVVTFLMQSSSFGAQRQCLIPGAWISCSAMACLA